MDIISLVMLILGAIGILGGFLFGRKRGLTKATVRLVLVGISALLAFLMRETITETVLNTPIEDGKSILELLTEGMISGDDAETMKGFVTIITNVFTMILQIFSFIICGFPRKKCPPLVRGAAGSRFTWLRRETPASSHIRRPGSRRCRERTCRCLPRRCCC